MTLARRQERISKRIVKKAAKRLLATTPKGKTEPIQGSSHVEVIGGLREMPIPPAPAGAPDMGDRDLVDPVRYRRAKNARKRTRRERRGT